MPQSVLAQEDSTEKRTVEAERFVLKDANGRMRAELSMSVRNNPILWFYDAGGERVTTLAEDLLFFSGPGISSGILHSGGAWFTDTNGAKLTLAPGSLTMSEGVGVSSILGEDRIKIVGGDDPMISITDEETFEYVLGHGGARFFGDTPRITIVDAEGFQAVLGSTGTVETRTGRTNQTSAASLILFGKDGTAIWSAPDN